MLGFLGPALRVLTGIGQIAGGAAKHSSDERSNENQQQLQRSQLLNQIYGINQNAQSQALQSGSNERLAQGNLDLNQRNFQQDQRQFALTAPSTRGRQAVRGSLMQNLQPMTLSGLPDRISSRIPTISGGLTPAAFSPEVRQMGGMLQRDAILGQLKGDPVDTFAPMQQTDFQSGVLTPPQIAELEKSGLLEKILGGTGLIGSLLGGLSGQDDLFKKRRQPMDENPQPTDPWSDG
jgi:hypothetical protein